MDHPFRSAAVGGFNRQDVLAYLEERAKLAAQAEQKLQDQLDEVNHQAEALRRERDGLRCELEDETLPAGWVWADRAQRQGRYAIPSAFAPFQALVEEV